MRFFFGLLAAGCVISAATSNAGAQTPAPAPAFDARDLYAGTWTGSVTDHPGGGVTTSTTTCAWQGGRVYLVCEVHYQAPTGAGEQLTVFTRSTDGKYEFSLVSPHGSSFDMEIPTTANSWTYQSQYDDQGTPVLRRVVNTWPSADRYRVRGEISRDGGRHWQLTSEGLQRRVSAP